MPTIEEQYEGSFLRRAEVDNLLVQNQEQTDKLIEDRKNLRSERERLSRALEKLQVAKTIQTHEEAAAAHLAKADAAHTEAEALKADVANQLKAMQAEREAAQVQAKELAELLAKAKEKPE